MNFRESYAAAIAANDTERIRNLEDQAWDMAWDMAYERACELDSLSSLDFDALRESIFEELLS